MQSNEAQKLAKLAVSYQKNDKHELADTLIQNALLIEPENSDYLFFHGLMRYELNHLYDAIDLIRKAILYNPKKSLYHYNLGVIYKELHLFNDALVQQKMALILDPDNTHYINEIGFLYIELDNILDARKTLEKSLTIDSRNTTTHSYYAYLLRKENDPAEAIKYAKQALSLNSESSAAYMNLGQALIMTNQIKEGIDCIRKSFNYGSHHRLESQQSLLLNLLYLEDISPKEIYAQHLSFCQSYIPPTNISEKKSSNNTSKNPLLVGFVSSDFREHSVAYFLQALVENYNRSSLCFYFYSGVAIPDTKTQELKSKVDYWRDIHNLTTTEIAEQIQRDEIDILLDLSGHSKGNFLPVFSLKPAKIQVSFLGYPCTTGLGAMDYKISDDNADPIGTTEKIHSEKLLRIDSSFLCYTPNSENYITERLPLENNKYVTFGSFNKFSKLSHKILNIWSKILFEVDNSILIIKNNQPISNLLCKNILSVFTSNGISENRIKFRNPTSTNDGHMHQYNGIDICLDTYPYTGTTTTFEALWMGVPVITLAGVDHRSRVGYSILKSLSQEKLIANSSEEYVNIAKSLATNINEIKIYRYSLRNTLKSSVLMDGPLYAKKFKASLQSIWREHDK